MFVTTFDITIQNYRCFSDHQPARLSIDGGMIALLGPNNSGKSSLMKFFHEFRNLWTALEGQIRAGRPNASNPFQAVHVNDQTEIFHDRNDRGITITIEFDAAEIIEIYKFNVGFPNKVKITILRSESGPFSYALNFFSNGNPMPFNAVDSDGLLTNGDTYKFHAFHFLEFLGIATRSLYIGPFRNAITSGAGAHFDLAVGDLFIQQWSDWQGGVEKAKNHAVSEVIDTIKTIMNFETLQIMSAMSNKTLQLTIDGRSYKLNEVGSGLAQMVVVLGNALIRKPSLLLIDEPELNLHPRLQLDFLTSLARFCSFGVIFATHSVGLARSAAERIYTVVKRDAASLMSPFERTPEPLELLGELNFSAARELGAEALLLVEGTHDVKVMQQLLRKYGKDHQVVIIPLGGTGMARGGVEAELGEFKRVHSNIFAVVDSERAGEGERPHADREAFQRTCTKLGYKVLVTERRATENYFSERAIKATLGEKYRALGPYELLRDVQPSWAKHDNWRIAQAMTRAEIDATDIGKFLAGIEGAKREGKATDNA